jgi:hypothetical protein
MSESLCSLCQFPTAEADALEHCPECGAAYHAACFAENGGCGTYGCSRVPAPEAQRAAPERPTAWGREFKSCPACGREIRAAALLCRFCGARFESVDPVGREEYEASRRRAALAAERARRSRWALALALLPLTAPVGLFLGCLVLQRGSGGIVPRQSRLLAQCAIGLSLAWAGIVLLVLVVD